MATNELIDANKALREFPEQALSMYTTLTNSRHPVAFLNRSLCYLALNRPELAVMDAERAFRITEPGSRSPILHEQVSSYAAACEAMTEIASWETPRHLISASNPRRHLYLSNLTITNTPRSTQKSKKAVQLDAFDDIRIKALFRQAFALWKLGSGAQRTALTILERANILAHGLGKQDFAWLGSVIAIDLQEQCNLVRSSEVRLTSFENLMATRYTFVRNAAYNIHEKHHQIINESLKQLDSTAIVESADIDGQNVFISTQDVFSQDVLFTENTSLSVSTASTEDPKFERFCESCSATIDISDGFFDILPYEDQMDHVGSHTPRSVASDSATIGFPEHADTDVYGYDKRTPHDDRMDLDVVQHHHKQHVEDRTYGASTRPVSPIPPPPPPHKTMVFRCPSEDLDPDFKRCDCCEDGIFWCSIECESLAFRTHHSLMCGHGLEEDFRRVLSEKMHPDVPSRHKRLITMMMLARILSWTTSDGKHPLEHPLVKLLSAASDHESESNVLAWSYDTHIVAPIDILTALDASKSDIAYDTKKRDGDVINTLINLIECQLSIASQQPWRKTFNNSGILVENIETGSDHELVSEIQGATRSRQDSGLPPTVFYGRLHPLCGLLPTSSKDTPPNVELVDLGNSKIICIPISLESSTQPDSVRHVIAESPVLRSGESLVLSSRSVRPGTSRERQMYQKVLARTSSPSGSENIEDTLMAYAADDNDEIQDVQDHWSCSADDGSSD